MEQTIVNLAKAFIGESQARNRYDFYAKIARNEGYEQIAEIFLITSANEKEHAKKIFEHLTGLLEKSGKTQKEVKVDVSAPCVYGSTAENLKSAIDGEHYEYSEMYPDFAGVAGGEGLIEVANRLRAIAKAEMHHEERYKKLLKEVEAGSVFKKDKEVEWVCRECGYVHKGKEPPKVCPSCSHSMNFYQVKCEEY